MTDPDGTALQALRSAALGPHARIEELLDAAVTGRAPGDEPRRARELADSFMATTSRHLSAADDVLLPLARNTLSEGHDLVAAYVLQARELEQVMHAVKAWEYGDANARHLHGDDLWSQARRLLADHESREGLLVDGLGGSLSDDQLAGLADRLRRTEEHAPTRPHPFTPHTGRLGRLTHRVWSVLDRLWDSAESRVIPHRDRPPHPRRDSLLSRYALGAPRFDDPEREDRAERES